MIDRDHRVRHSHTVRGALRACLLTVWSCLCWLGFECAQLGWFVSGRRRRHPRAKWSRRWSSGVLRLLGVKVRITPDSPEIPEAPYLLVSNHLSYLDILVYGSITGATFLSKAEVRNWPLIGFLSRRAGTLYVKRESARDAVRAVDQIRRRLNEGFAVAVFPEATSSDGSRVLPFHPTLFDASVKTRGPTLCAALYYEVPRGFDAGEQVCWWGDMTFADHVWGLLKVPWVRAHVALAPALEIADDRRALAGEANRLVGGLHQQLVVAAHSQAAPETVSGEGHQRRGPRWLAALRKEQS